MPEAMFGPYRLDGLLGAGGMGEVHRAFDTDHDRVVALKLLPAQLSTDQEYRQRFRREARIAAQLNDPHIVPIHRYGEIDGRLYLDMRLVDGDNLATLLSRQKTLTPEEAVGLVEQLASALDAAHSHGLIHRDIKPSNVLLTRPVRAGAPRFAYLGDFGIARMLSSSTSSVVTSTGAIVGTLDYMAPERFRGQAVDARADIYSLACLPHECLTGIKPFPGDELPALMHAHLNLNSPKPSADRSGVPAALDKVVACGMAKDPADRYPSAGDLAEAARHALVPVPARDTATVDTARPVVAAPIAAKTTTESPATSGPPGIRADQRELRHLPPVTAVPGGGMPTAIGPWTRRAAIVLLVVLVVVVIWSVGAILVAGR